MTSLVSDPDEMGRIAVKLLAERMHGVRDYPVKWPCHRDWSSAAARDRPITADNRPHLRSSAVRFGGSHRKSCGAADMASAQLAGRRTGPPGGRHGPDLDVQGLSANTTYYFAIKTPDEAGNWPGLSNVASSTTLTSSDLNKPVLTEQDFEYLGAFRLPTYPYGQSTGFALGGIAIRRVDGNLRMLATSGPCGFPRSTSVSLLQLGAATPVPLVHWPLHLQLGYGCPGQFDVVLGVSDESGSYV